MKWYGCRRLFRSRNRILFYRLNRFLSRRISRGYNRLGVFQPFGNSDHIDIRIPHAIFPYRRVVRALAVRRRNEVDVIIRRVDGTAQMFGITPLVRLGVDYGFEAIVAAHTLASLTAEVEGHVVLVDEWTFLVEFCVDLGSKVAYVGPLSFAVKRRPVDVDAAKSARTVACKIKCPLI